MSISSVIKSIYSIFDVLFFSVKLFRYPAGITSLAFSSEGNMLAIASSYNYEYGADIQLAPTDVTKNNIFVRRVSDLETKPK